MPRDQEATLGVDILLFHEPIQAGADQGISRGGSLLHLSPQAILGIFTDIEHSFNVCGHDFYLLI